MSQSGDSQGILDFRLSFVFGTDFLQNETQIRPVEF